MVTHDYRFSSREFTIDEDLLILEYIVVNEKYDQVNCDDMWKSLAEMIFNCGMISSLLFVRTKTYPSWDSSF